MGDITEFHSVFTDKVLSDPVLRKLELAEVTWYLAATIEE